VRSRRLAPDLPDWWWISARYPTAQMAKAAWERVERRLARGSLGFYRHGTTDAMGCEVTAVSIKRDEVERCVRLLRDGQDNPLDDELLDSMIVRRARVVVEEVAKHGDVSGRVKTRHPEDAGAVLDRQGVMHPRKRPEG
jgi:hypothetical protein